MTKNMTRKGLALGAASALLISGFTALPASSAGLADTSFVSLAPTTGTEYNVLAVTGSEFSLSSNEAVTVSTGDLKWLVTDASGVVEPKLTDTTSEAVTLASWTADDSDNEVTITKAGHGLTTGDVIKISGLQTITDTGGTPESAVSYAELDDTTYVVTVTSSSIFVVADAVAADIATTVANDTTYSKASTGTFTQIRSIRSASATYVVNSGSTDESADEILVLKKDASATARSVTVQAWMDANNNGVIDSTEYTSPVRTVSWLAAADVTAVTTVDYPTAGASDVTGSVVLTPNLNGQQQSTTSDVQIGFTRPGSTATIYVDATQGATTRAWTATQSLETGNWIECLTLRRFSQSLTATSTP